MSLGPMAVLDTYAVPRQTQTAGTAIVALVPPRKWRKTKLTFLQYTSAGTAHTGTIMKELARTTLFAAAAGAAVTLVLNRDPGKYSTDPTMGGVGPNPPVAGQPQGRGITPSVADNLIAANDYIVLALADGTFLVTKPSAAVTDSTTGRVTLTVAAIPASGANAGATVWYMGITTDLDPQTGVANGAVLKPTVSATTVFPNAAGAGGAVIEQSRRPDSPLLIFFDNITAAGTLDMAAANYGT